MTSHMFWINREKWLMSCNQEHLKTDHFHRGTDRFLWINYSTLFFFSFPLKIFLFPFLYKKKVLETFPNGYDSKARNSNCNCFLFSSILKLPLYFPSRIKNKEFRIISIILEVKIFIKKVSQTKLAQDPH